MTNKTLLRIVLLLTVSLVLMMVGRHSSFSYYFSLDFLLDAILDAGGYGVVIFILLYTVGTLMNIPGVLFLLVAFMVWGTFKGSAIGYVGTLVAMVSHFYFVRGLAGKALSEVKNKFVLRQLERLTERPIRTTVVLRLILFVSPPVNYGLALSSINFKDFLIGSMIAMPVNLLLNVALFVFGKEWLMHWFT